MFFPFFLQKTNSYGPKGLQNEIFKNRIRFGRDIRILKWSAQTQCALKSFQCWLSSDELRVCLADFEWRLWNWLQFPLMLSMHKNWLLIGWACVKVGHSLAEHTQKHVPRWLSLRENWLLTGWAYPKIISAHTHSTRFYQSSIVTRSSVSCSRPLSPVLCLMSLFLVSCPLSPFSHPCS